MTELRLIDPEGYTVPGGVHVATPDTDQKIRTELQELAVQHAAEWADFGYRSSLYRVQETPVA